MTVSPIGIYRNLYLCVEYLFILLPDFDVGSMENGGLEKLCCIRCVLYIKRIQYTAHDEPPAWRILP